MGKLENPGADTPVVAEEISWSTLDAPGSTDDEDDEDDIPISEDDERTDRVEIPSGFLEMEGLPSSDDAGMNEPFADERTPMEAPSMGMLDEYLAGPKEPTDGVLIREMEERHQKSAATWQLRTPSGLTFKFTDPEALLGWKKKLATYKRLDVSPDGERWVDFARFVREFEELGDPIKAFILSEKLSDSELPPPKPIVRDDEPEPEESTDEDIDERARKERSKESTMQFTFKVKDEKSSGWGKYLLFALLGLGLGAGIVVAVLHFTGVWSPLP